MRYVSSPPDCTNVFRLLKDDRLISIWISHTSLPSFFRICRPPLETNGFFSGNMLLLLLMMMMYDRRHNLSPKSKEDAFPTFPSFSFHTLLSVFFRPYPFLLCLFPSDFYYFCFIPPLPRSSSLKLGGLWDCAYLPCM